MKEIFDIFLHLDKFLSEHLSQWAQVHGLWLPYLVLFAIIFCETGLVVTPFLPGDSLLFAIGALASNEEFPLDLWFVGILLSAAAILGDAVNYSIGFRVGPKVFTREDSRLLNKKHLIRTQRFYEKHGGKTIFLARFIPIIRTFAPFVAGIGQMRYTRFAIYNVTGGITWVFSLLLVGRYFARFPWVKGNFPVVIVAIIAISCVPVAVEYLRARREGKREEAAATGTAAGSPESAQPRTGSSQNSET